MILTIRVKGSEESIQAIKKHFMDGTPIVGDALVRAASHDDVFAERDRLHKAIAGILQHETYIEDEELIEELKKLGFMT